MVAVLAAPFGCFVVWRRMAYFGDTMAHSALLGITLSLLLEIHTGIGVFAIVLSYLFGDVLSVGRSDILITAITALLSLTILVMIWKPLLASSVNPDLAIAEGGKPQLVQTIYLLLLAAVIAVTVQIIGVLLITALLVIPAATARAGPSIVVATLLVFLLSSLLPRNR